MHRHLAWLGSAWEYSIQVTLSTGSIYRLPLPGQVWIHVCSLMTDMPSIAQYAAGIGPYKVSITDGLTNRSEPPPLVKLAYDLAGLQI